MYAKLTNGALPITKVERSPTELVKGRKVRIRSLTPEQRLALDWVSFVAKRVDDDTYDRGTPVDTLDLANHRVSRSFPNATPRGQNHQRRKRLEELKEIYEYKRTLDFTFGGHSISTDPVMRSHIAMIAQFMAVDAGSFPIQRKDNGAFVQVNATQAQALFVAMMNHIRAVDAAADAHVGALQALSDPQQILNYDLTSGWPV